ncbi:DEAD-box ATP-dependent RNA helicase 22 [Olea europaea subsp. europaea]|uniref:DEAD-box ATP-dependent RNA helicase 22 n=1 Tax=Olea europaea subsp. europaea TaxID=158383 RepID=A0A8S0PLX4_OLEEU|nr:DEAD-box ATP-dependent RNA helicase 22 [Olea europaea subsp. europaea]
MLCEQVVRMANSLCGYNSKPLLRVAAICGRQGLPVKQPDILVSTSVALLNFLYAIDTEKCRRSDFIRGAKYVVFDEADLFLCGSFQNQIVRLINMLRFDEKLLSRMRSASSGEQDLNSVALKVSDTEDEDYPQADLNVEDDKDTDDNSDVENVETKSEFINRKDWRIRKIYERSKQHILVAATLPVNGKKTAGGVLKRMFPDANWVSGNYLHCHNSRLEQKWTEVTTDSQVDALINAVNGLSSSVDSGSGIVRTMVFANTVEAVAKILTGAGVKCFHFHMSLQKSVLGILLISSRKVEFSCAQMLLLVDLISHIFHILFRQNLLLLLLYTEANRDLISAVRQVEKLGPTMEKSFSRKRSFRNKLKKRSFSKRSDAPSVPLGVTA